MAVELCPAQTKPRISFSHGFCSSMQQYCPPLRSTSLLLNSSTEFEFDVPINNIDQVCFYSPADELFSNGKILPLQIKKKFSPPKQEEQPPSQKPQPQAGNARSKDKNQSSKSFWQFKRSSSLNFVSGYKRRLFPSTLLSRSSSTESAPKVKPGPDLRDGHGIDNHRQKKNNQKKSLPCLQSSTNNEKPPLKNSFTCGSHGNGVTINLILNVPLVDVNCLSSVFLTGKDRKK